MACNERGIRQWSSHKEFGYAERNRRATDLDRVSRRSRPFQSLAVRGGAQAAEPVQGRDARQEIGRATSELQSLMRISYAVFCLKKKKQKHDTKQYKKEPKI